MYQLDNLDREFVLARASAFRDQLKRHLDGTLPTEAFTPLRLRSGLYRMLHAYMLRINIPYGTLSAAQLRKLADVADRWDRGYGHFTTRQNMQLNWIALNDVPDILQDLAEVGLHTIQSSGNCIRNVTADPLAGAGADATADPRPVAELIRQWAAGHPEFNWLPRKFKIAVTGSDQGREALRFHDIGLRLVSRDGAPGFEVSLGGGLGRTPMVGKVLRDFLPQEDLLPWLEAAIQVYNLRGRRDNKYKARVKITLLETGIDALAAEIESRLPLERARFNGAEQNLLHHLQTAFAPPAFDELPMEGFDRAWSHDPVFRAFVRTNTIAHRRADHAIVTISLKRHGDAPGDASSAQMRLIAALAESFSHGEIRVSQRQNLILPHVHKANLPELHARLRSAGLATANAGLLSDIIACPGMDYCDLATAHSIPVARDIARHFKARESDIGPLSIKVSGCINACAHHHVGDIGILGLQKGGVESYQITLGGNPGPQATIGRPLGPGFSRQAILGAVETIIDSYLALRRDRDESFAALVRRLGTAPFRAALYGEKEKPHAA